jgi:hypothetical protein
MRITDDRYTQEHHRFQLGLRLLRLQAKSATIRDCAGLTEDRVRKLFKTYLEGQSNTPLRRKRGKSPHEPAMLLRNARAHLQSSVLATLLSSLNVIASSENQPAHQAAACTARTERCCEAFEYYLQLFDDPQFTFEHAWLLVALLSRRSERDAELKLLPCPQCHAQSLQDLLAFPLRPCPFCGGKSDHPVTRLVPRQLRQ